MAYNREETVMSAGEDAKALGSASSHVKPNADSGPSASAGDSELTQVAAAPPVAEKSGGAESEEETDEEETSEEGETDSEEEETDSEEEETSSEEETETDEEDWTDSEVDLHSTSGLPPVERPSTSGLPQIEQQASHHSRSWDADAQAGPGPSSSSVQGPPSRGEPGGLVEKKTTKLPPIKSAQRAKSSRPIFEDPIQHRKVPPRPRHPTENVDPDFIKTAAYTNRPGVGQVYDWEAHHNQNKHIEHQKNEQRRACQLIDAARKELENRSNSERAFQKWLKQKEREKSQVAARRRELLHWQTAPMMHSDPPEVRANRERRWCDSFGQPAYVPAKGAPLSGR